MAKDKAHFIDSKTMKRLLDNPDKRSKQGLRDYPILLLLSLGLRRQELCGLNRDDFDRTGWLQVRTVKQGVTRKVKLTPEIVKVVSGSCPILGSIKCQRPSGLLRCSNKRFTSSLIATWTWK